MEGSVDILIILPYIKHHSLTKWWRNALSFDWNPVLVHRRSHAVVQHYVVLLFTALRGVSFRVKDKRMDGFYIKLKVF
jgi:hypothetical protein